MYFNKEWQPSLTEVAKEQKQLPQNFPIDAFLEAYNEWDKTPNNSSIDERTNTRQSLFAKLRDLHQQYGVNTNKWLDFWNAEEEVHAFAKYLKKRQDNKVDTQKNLSDAKDEISQKFAESVNINGQEIKKWDAVILNDTNATFTWNYKVDQNGKIIEIEITINGKPWYAQVKDIVFIEKWQDRKHIDLEQNKTLRYKITTYRGFAEQELKNMEKP